MKVKGFIASIFAGFFVVLLGVNVIGYTAAIAMPKGLAEYIRSSDYGQVIFALWNLIVVQLPSVGLLSLLITSMAIKLLPWSNWWKGIGIVFGAIGLAYALSPEPLQTFYIGHHVYEITVILSVLPLSYYSSRKRSASQS